MLTFVLSTVEFQRFVRGQAETEQEGQNICRGEIQSIIAEGNSLRINCARSAVRHGRPPNPIRWISDSNPFWMFEVDELSIMDGEKGRVRLQSRNGHTIVLFLPDDSSNLDFSMVEEPKLVSA
jgi:hypothetical protein